MFAACLAFFLSCVFFVLGSAILFSYRKFYKHAIKVPGVVTGYKSQEIARTTIYYVIVTFEFDGQKREFTYSCPLESRPAIGCQCPLGINLTNTQDIRIWSTNDYKIVFWVLMGCCLVAFGVGISLVLHLNAEWFCIGIMSFLSIVMGGRLFWSELMFFRRAILVPGTVVSCIGSGRNKAWTIEFECNGQKCEITRAFHASEPKIGGSCLVGVDPLDSQSARLYSEANFVVYLVILAMGVVTFIWFVCNVGAK